MKFSIDRIEENIAVCEFDNGDIKEVPLNELPENVTEGSVLELKNGKYYLDSDETENRRAKNYQLLQDLFRND